MFIVRQHLADFEEVIGTCDLSTIFRRLDSALDLIGSMLPTDSSIGVMDICTQDCEVTLPDEVEVPLAVNVAGHPASFRNKWYEHHLNGVGSECCGQSCSFGWQNQGLYPVFRELTEPCQLLAFCDSPLNPIPSITIYGEDENGKPLYSCQGDGCQTRGLILPIMSGSLSLAPLEGSPKVKRIYQVTKPATCDFVRLIALDPGRQEGTLIGYYRPDEQVPAYRRLKLTGWCNQNTGCSTSFSPDQNCCDPALMKLTWVRMRYQKKQQPITSINDLIAVPSKEALLQALEAVKQYRANNKDEGDKYLAAAREFLEAKQESLEGPNSFQAQYPDGGTYGGDQIHNMI